MAKWSKEFNVSHDPNFRFHNITGEGQTLKANSGFAKHLKKYEKFDPNSSQEDFEQMFLAYGEFDVDSASNPFLKVQSISLRTLLGKENPENWSPEKDTGFRVIFSKPVFQAAFFFGREEADKKEELGQVLIDPKDYLNALRTMAKGLKGGAEYLSHEAILGSQMAILGKIKDKYLANSQGEIKRTFARLDLEVKLPVGKIEDEIDLNEFYGLRGQRAEAHSESSAAEDSHSDRLEKVFAPVDDPSKWFSAAFDDMEYGTYVSVLKQKAVL